MSLASMFHSIAGWFEKAPAEEAATDARNALKTTFFSSKRFVLIIALVAFIYLTYSVLNLEILKLVGNVAIVYIICETLSNLAVTIGNIVIKLHEVKLDIEYEKLKGYPIGIAQQVAHLPLAGSIAASAAPPAAPVAAIVPTQPSKP
ncbi:MAG: hypothetical protein WC869_00895 [Phycisphaerae bacterium]|jgi:hypothetical protein